MAALGLQAEVENVVDGSEDDDSGKKQTTSKKAPATPSATTGERAERAEAGARVVDVAEARPRITMMLSHQSAPSEPSSGRMPMTKARWLIGKSARVA